jgi:hypothetical protein
MARVLNKKRPYGTITAPPTSYNGALWEQDGCYFNPRGRQVFPDGLKVPDIKDQAPRMSDGELLENLMDTEGLDVVGAAERVKDIREEEAEIKALKEPEPDEPDEPPPNVAEDSLPKVPTKEGLPPWDWTWTEQRVLCKEIGIQQPNNKADAIGLLQQHYGYQG